MSLLQLDGISKSFGALHLFEDLSFTISKGQKIGLIAPNGTGKTTLLEIIAGRESADSGKVITRNDLRVAYLSQKQDFSIYPDVLSACISGIDPEIRDTLKSYEEALILGDVDRLTTLLPEMDALGVWGVEQELAALLSQLKIDNPKRTTKGLSGGETKRIALASVLLGDADLLILDEPTNHLDPDVIEWLENYLSARNVALLMVTHDRYFLDRVCSSIYEIEDGTLYTYDGNYTTYLQKKEERAEQLARERQSLKNLYKKELEWMRRMPQARATKAKFRQDAFYELEASLSGEKQTDQLHLQTSSVYIGKKIFEAKGVSKSFDGKEVISDFSYTFARRDRVGVIGPNGAGKSTLIKMILGELEPDGGSVEVGETVRFGYFSQAMASFPSHKRVIDVVSEKSELIRGEDGKSISAMQLLNRFLFAPSRQQDYVEKLSGGELRRLQLCLVLMESPNFLVLDEPTNDLDIPTLQVLEDYLANFNGCLLIVSHDRYFMDNLTEHLFVLSGDGSVEDFPGNYTQYRLQSQLKEEPKERPRRPSSSSGVREEAREQKRGRDGQKRRLSYKENREFEQLSEEIPLLEKRLGDLSSVMSRGDSSSEELLQAAEEYQELREKLDGFELRWLELSEFT